MVFFCSFYFCRDLANTSFFGSLPVTLCNLKNLSTFIPPSDLKCFTGEQRAPDLSTLKQQCDSNSNPNTNCLPFCDISVIIVCSLCTIPGFFVQDSHSLSYSSITISGQLPSQDNGERCSFSYALNVSFNSVQLTLPYGRNLQSVGHLNIENSTIIIPVVTDDGEFPRFSVSGNGRISIRNSQIIFIPYKYLTTATVTIANNLFEFQNVTVSVENSSCTSQKAEDNRSVAYKVACKQVVTTSYIAIVTVSISILVLIGTVVAVVLINRKKGLAPPEKPSPASTQKIR
jgi:hypothetical protein